RDGGADAVFVEHIHEAEDTDAIAVIAHCPGRDVRHLAGGARWNAIGQREEFDIGNDPERDARTVRPLQLLASDDRRIFERTVGCTWLHVIPPPFAAASRERQR